MRNLNFWKGWKLRYRGIYQVLLLIFLVSIAYSFYNQYNSFDLAHPMDVVRKTQSIELSLQNVQDFIFELPVPARNYIIFQSFLPLESGFKLSGTYLLIAIIFCCFSILMTASTYLSRWWFIIFQSVFVIWIITLKLQFLKIFGIENQLFTFLFVGLILVSGYYLHAYKESASLFLRWMIFAIILISLMALVTIGSTVEAPIVFMAHHGIIVPVLLAIIFIFNIAYDIILHILYLLADKKNKEEGSNLMHFIIISLLYLIYVGLTFAKNDNLINIEIVYLNEFVLLAISAVLGIWGFRKRSELIDSQLSFRPLGGYVFLALGILTFTVIAWIFKNANDPLIDTFEDIIIFSHLGFGVLFFFYVLYNFVGLLKAGHGIYPVVFRPVNIPYNLVRGVGFAIVIILILRVSYLPYYQAISGYYVGLADYYEYIGEEEKAKTTYKIARQYAATSHKHNFKIGQMEYEEGNWAEASSYFNNANFKRPSVQSYIQRTQSQLNANLIFEALFTLEDAQKEFPNNAYLLNMRGIVYEKLNRTDSAFIYFDAAARAANNDDLAEVAQVNRLGLFAKNSVDEELPLQSELNDKSVAYQANYLALANRKRQFIDSIDLNARKIPEILTYNDFSFIFNLTLNKTLANQGFKADTIHWLTQIEENEDFEKSLKYATSSRQNYAGNVNSAYSFMFELENDNIADAGFYYLLHGMWLMDQKEYSKAEQHFAKAAELKMSKANTYRTIAMIWGGKLYEAAQLYRKEMNSEAVAANIYERDPLYQFLLGEYEKLPDSFKYLWLSTNSALTKEKKDSIFNDLRNSPFLMLHELNKTEQQIKNGDLELASNSLEEINIPSTEKGLLIYKNNLTALLSAINKDEDLANTVEPSILQQYPYNYKLIWQASTSLKEENNAKSDSLMLDLGRQNAFFETAVIYSAQYFIEKGEMEVAYDILVEASRINENSVEILKSYTLQALRMNLINYAEESYQKLRQSLNTDNWEKFSEEYERIKESMEEMPW